MKIVLYGIGICLAALIIILSLASLLIYTTKTYPKEEAQRIEEKKSREELKREKTMQETIGFVKKFYERNQ